MYPKFAVRKLTDQEIENRYLLLRQSALAGELRWTQASEASMMRDAYDYDAFCYGVFWEEQLLGAIRLVVKKMTRELPSGQYLPIDEFFGEKCAELGRAVVDKPFRGLNLFSVLVLHATIKALEIGAKHIYATIVDTPGGRAFSIAHGYKIIGEPFFYRDELIAVPEKTITVKLLHERHGDLVGMESRRNHLFKSRPFA